MIESYIISIFSFVEEPPVGIPSNSTQRVFSHPILTSITCFLDDVLLTGWRQNLRVILICIFLMSKIIENFMYYLLLKTVNIICPFYNCIIYSFWVVFWGLYCFCSTGNQFQGLEPTKIYATGLHLQPQFFNSEFLWYFQSFKYFVICFEFCFVLFL